MGSIPPQPPTHRRMASFRNTTMSWLKGTSRANSTSGHHTDRSRGGLFSSQTSPIRGDYNISEPIPFTFDDDPTRPEDFGKEIPRTISPRTVEPGRGRESIGLSRLMEENRATLSAGAEDTRGVSPAVSGRMSESDRAHTADDANAPKHTRKKGVKLKMALGLLRRRSNSNLRGKSAEQSGEESRGMSVSVPRALRSTDSGFLHNRFVPPVVTFENATPSTQQHHSSNPFRINIPVRSHSRHLLTKPPPPHLAPPLRRATVASVVYESPPRNKPSLSTSGWTTGVRPLSAASSIPHTPIHASRSDDENRASFLADGGVSQTGQATGLYPRPSSLRRHWSDGGRSEAAKKRQSAAETHHSFSPGQSSKRTSGGEKIRPLSFSGIMNGYGTMKITEAVSLESRVKELESQVATLKGFISEYLDIQTPPRPSTAIARHSAPAGVVGLLPPFEEKASPPPEPRRRFSFSSANNLKPPIESLSPPQSPAITIDKLAAGPLTSLTPPPPIGLGLGFEYDNSPARASAVSEDYDVSLEAGPGGLTSPHASKRNTASTDKTTGSVSFAAAPPISASESPELANVSIAQFTGLVTMIKRERGARRKLERQLAQLQEQMAAIMMQNTSLLVPPASPSLMPTDARLSASFGPSPSSHSTTSTSSSSRAVSIANELRKKASQEVPTPELTPPPHPRLRNASLGDSFGVARDSFAGFDSPIERAVLVHGEGSFFTGPGEGSELEGSEADEGDLGLETEDEDEDENDTMGIHPKMGMGQLSVPVSPTNPRMRSLSLSQLTNAPATE